MNFVWDRGKVSVADVWAAISSKRKIARNTVQTTIVRLRDKGWLNEEVKNNTFFYRATRKRQGTQKRMLKDLLDRAFGGSTEGLLMTLLEEKKLTEEEADRIHKMIDESEKKRGR